MKKKKTYELTLDENETFELMNVCQFSVDCLQEALKAKEQLTPIQINNLEKLLLRSQLVYKKLNDKLQLGEIPDGTIIQ